MASEKPFVTLLREYRGKTRDALEVFLYSARKLPAFDPRLVGSPDAMEPYDAMAGRFERAVEMVLN